jgi:hypothetical protein
MDASRKGVIHDQRLADHAEQRGAQPQDWQRIRVHETAIAAVDARLAQRQGDQPFDVRAEDAFKTVGDLEAERQQYLDRVIPLTLIRTILSKTKCMH